MRPAPGAVIPPRPDKAPAPPPVSSGAKHAKPPQLDDLAALIQRLAEEFMATQFAAEHATTALDGFFAGWKAAERYYDKTRGPSEDPAS